jgi:hypothetical protein
MSAPKQIELFAGIGNHGFRTPTAEEIDRAKSQRGGWTRKTLAQWGVPWPPPKGWRKRLLAQAKARATWA